VKEPYIIDSVSLKNTIRVTSDVLACLADTSQQFLKPKKTTTHEDFITFLIEWYNKASRDINLLRARRFMDRICLHSDRSLESPSSYKIGESEELPHRYQH